MPIAHPDTGQPLTPLEIALWRLRMVAHEIHVMLRGFRRTGDVAKVINVELLFGLSNHSLPLICKFLEVWDSLNPLARTDRRIIDARRAVQPLVDRILVWPGLRSFRNTVLAHPYLDKDGNPVGPWEALAAEEAPTSHAEAILILHLVHFAVLSILTVFEGEYLPLRPVLRSPFPHPTPGPGISTGAEIPDALRPLLQEVDRRLDALGSPVRGELRTEFHQAIEGA